MNAAGPVAPRPPPPAPAPAATRSGDAGPAPAAAAPTRPQPAAAAPTPGAWRGGPDTEVGKAVTTMLGRARQSQVKLGNDTVENMLSKGILDNRNITNEQLLAMSKVPLEKLADTPKDRETTLKKIPDAREKDSHKFTVDLLHAVTGVDRAKLSEASPGLGMTGSPSTRLSPLYASKDVGVQRSTALHDFTDYMKGAGVEGVNKAVWGYESSTWSALKSYRSGVPYK